MFPAASSRLRILAAGGVVAVAGTVAYLNSFGGPFVYDDVPGILNNQSIRRLWPPWGALAVPAKDLTVSGRPIANLSFAINYALSGTDVWSYHALNLLIHILCGVTLFGIVRRTLVRSVCQARFDRDAVPLAMGIALLWVMHPLQTEAVTYLVQRVESLGSLFLLLTVYGFVRSLESPQRLRWELCAVTACLLGVSTKEVVVTAPVLVLLYDRTFAAGTFQKAIGRRLWMYVGLVATWIPLAYLVWSAGWNRGGSAGFGVRVGTLEYWFVQFRAVAHYLWLAVWPHPLVFEYGPLTGPWGGGSRARDDGYLPGCCRVVGSGDSCSASALASFWIPRRLVLHNIGADQCRTCGESVDRRASHVPCPCRNNHAWCIGGLRRDGPEMLDFVRPACVGMGDAYQPA